MKAIAVKPPTRAFAVIFEIGDEFPADLREFARERELGASRFTAIGAFENATIAYWDWDSKAYEEIAVDEQVEVLSLVGNVARDPEGEPKVHAHVVLGRRDGSTVGGHLLRANVRPTLEVQLTESAERLQRRKDTETGLDLIAGARARG